MTNPIAAIFARVFRASATAGNDAAPVARPPAPTIGQIIAALDDRNVLKAVELLDPTMDSAGSSPGRDGRPASRRVKCVGCGE
jgi:hypothetical protein